MSKFLPKFTHKSMLAIIEHHKPFLKKKNMNFYTREALQSHRKHITILS